MEEEGKLTLCDTLRKFQKLGMEHKTTWHIGHKEMVKTKCSIIFLKREMAKFFVCFDHLKIAP
jgi:hypothetical protein